MMSPLDNISCQSNKQLNAGEGRTLTRLGGRLLQAVQILYVVSSAGVADALNHSHSVLVVLLVRSVLTDRVESAHRV